MAALWALVISAALTIQTSLSIPFINNIVLGSSAIHTASQFKWSLHTVYVQTKPQIERNVLFEKEKSLPHSYMN